VKFLVQATRPPAIIMTSSTTHSNHRCFGGGVLIDQTEGVFVAAVALDTATGPASFAGKAAERPSRDNIKIEIRTAGLVRRMAFKSTFMARF
jgi:hypothetical protein